MLTIIAKDVDHQRDSILCKTAETVPIPLVEDSVVYDNMECRIVKRLFYYKDGHSVVELHVPKLQEL